MCSACARHVPRSLWYRTNKQIGEQMPCPEECVEACMRSLLCAKCLEGLPGAATDVEQLSEGEPTLSTAARLCFTQCIRQCIITKMRGFYFTQCTRQCIITLMQMQL